MFESICVTSFKWDDNLCHQESAHLKVLGDYSASTRRKLLARMLRSSQIHPLGYQKTGRVPDSQELKLAGPRAEKESSGNQVEPLRIPGD
jgi:hypothetical protein